MIGRIREQDYIRQCLESGRPEFLVLYGRRRVGKTFLIREYFHESFAFYATGVAREKTAGQLRIFCDSLRRYGDKHRRVAKDWLEAFSRLRDLLSREDVPRDPVSGKMIVFLDELPWMDTPRSNFRSALEYFWNSWGSVRSDLLLIACGSATSWIIKHLLNSRGGFYNRVTRQIHLAPFTLAECEQLLNSNGFDMSQQQVLECYMIFGGIPHYLNCLDKRMSLAQNIDTLILHPGGQLHYEYERLFDSLFKNAKKHISIIEALAAKRGGLMRTDLARIKKIGDGQPLTTALQELEQCGFIRKYRGYNKRRNGNIFQLTDPFTMFHFYFQENKDLSSWVDFMNSPGYYTWRGNAFENVCLNHISQMKAALGITGVVTKEYSWRSLDRADGSQIDLIIERRDQITHLCEMKFTEDEYEVSKEEFQKLQHRHAQFIKETGTKNSVQILLVSANGVKRNMYTDIAQHVITAKDLFAL